MYSNEAFCPCVDDSIVLSTASIPNSLWIIPNLDPSPYTLKALSLAKAIKAFTPSAFSLTLLIASSTLATWALTSFSLSNICP